MTPKIKIIPKEARFEVIDGILVDHESIETYTTDDESSLDSLSDHSTDVPKMAKLGDPGKDPRNTQSLYGRKGKVKEDELKRRIGPDSCGGLLYHVNILKNEDSKDPNLLKPRRPNPFPITLKNFESSVTRIGEPIMAHLAEEGYDDLWDRESRPKGAKEATEDATEIYALQDNDNNARWIFSGVLNGWPGLTTLELLSIQYQSENVVEALISKKKVKPGKKNKKRWKVIWDVKTDGEYGAEPSDALKQLFSEKKKKSIFVQATLRAPQWSYQGWSKESPGFVFWVEGQTTNTPFSLVLTYGTNLIKHFQNKPEGEDVCEKVHMISHRYAKKRESAKDLLTYHSIVLLEWDHGEYCTVVEIAWLNGLTGAKCRCNFYHDKDATPYSQLYSITPPEMVLPWKNKLSEIRAHDVPYKNFDDFMTNFMKPYEGVSGRFLDINSTFSHEVRLTHNTRLDICKYLLNYIRRDRTYSEMRRNCQTFAADLCGFLAGKKDVKPFHIVNQIEYTNHIHYFLYESSKYRSRKKGIKD